MASVRQSPRGAGIGATTADTDTDTADGASSAGTSVTGTADTDISGTADAAGGPNGSDITGVSYTGSGSTACKSGTFPIG